MKARKILLWVFAVIALAINVLIMVESFMGGDSSSSQSHGFTQMVIELIRAIDPNSILLEDVDTLHAVLRKLFGHFLLFGGSGLFTTLTLLMLEDAMEKRKRFVAIATFSFGLVWAAISELIQYFVPDRYGALTDILIDFSGYALFAVIVYVIFLIIYFKTKQMIQHELFRETEEEYINGLTRGRPPCLPLRHSVYD